MPLWAQIIIGLAAVVTAAGVLWAKAIRPAARFITSAEQMIPVVQDLTAELKDTPDSFAILKQIIAQFRTDSGSSLRDVVDRLEQWAAANEQAIEALTAESAARRDDLRVSQEATRLLAQEDRNQIARLVVALERVDSKITAVSVHAEGVAADLDASHARAEQTSGEAGAAADAAMQRPPDATEAVIQ